MTAERHSAAPSTHSAAKHAAAPVMSFFIWAWTSSPGLRAMPPESYMIPLPTNARWPVASPSGR